MARQPNAFGLPLAHELGFGPTGRPGSVHSHNSRRSASKRGLRVQLPGLWERVRFSHVHRQEQGGERVPMIWLHLEDARGRKLDVSAIWTAEEGEALDRLVELPAKDWAITDFGLERAVGARLRHHGAGHSRSPNADTRTTYWIRPGSMRRASARRFRLPKCISRGSMGDHTDGWKVMPDAAPRYLNNLG
jgi:hypothetical protein